MNNKQPESELKPLMQQDSPLQVEDLVRFLLRLAGLHKDPRTGNPEISKGLQAVANALKSHSNKLLKELPDALSDMAAADKGKPQQPKLELPPDLQSLNADAIFAIINNQEYTKLQIIDLGVQRFGISRSKLMRLNKESVSESIRAALDHEISLGIISQEARRGGEKRTS
jgi:hypothetical protein